MTWQLGDWCLDALEDRLAPAVWSFAPRPVESDTPPARMMIPSNHDVPLGPFIGRLATSPRENGITVHREIARMSPGSDQPIGIAFHHGEIGIPPGVFRLMAGTPVTVDGSASIELHPAEFHPVEIREQLISRLEARTRAILPPSPTELAKEESADHTPSSTAPVPLRDVEACLRQDEVVITQPTPTIQPIVNWSAGPSLIVDWNDAETTLPTEDAVLPPAVAAAAIPTAMPADLPEGPAAPVAEAAAAVFAEALPVIGLLAVNLETLDDAASDVLGHLQVLSADLCDNLGGQDAVNMVLGVVVLLGVVAWVASTTPKPHTPRLQARTTLVMPSKDTSDGCRRNG